MKFDSRKFSMILYDNGIKKKDLAKRCGISHTAVCYYSKGKSSPPADKLCRIAKELNCSVDDFMSDEIEKPIGRFLAIEIAKEVIERGFSPDDLTEIARHLIAYADNQKGFEREVDQ